MRGQITLDLDAGRARRDSGVRAVELAEWRDDKRRIDAVIQHFAQTGAEFCADDVTPFLPEGIRPNSIGAAFLRAAKKHLIVECGWRPSGRPEAHSRKVTVWRGNRHPSGGVA